MIANTSHEKLLLFILERISKAKTGEEALRCLGIIEQEITHWFADKRRAENEIDVVQVLVEPEGDWPKKRKVRERHADGTFVEREIEYCPHKVEPLTPLIGRCKLCRKEFVTRPKEEPSHAERDYYSRAEVEEKLKEMDEEECAFRRDLVTSLDSIFHAIKQAEKNPQVGWAYSFEHLRRRFLS